MVTRRDAWADARQDKGWLAKRPNANVNYGGTDDVVWQTRIGHLLPKPGDQWWEVAPAVDRRALALRVVEAIRDY
jgi:hypothetical protein